MWPVKTWETVLKLHHIAAGLFILVFFFAVVYLSHDINYLNLFKNQIRVKRSESSADNIYSSQQCDHFSGRWVYDNVSYPLYEESQCAFMEGAFACQKYGRKNLKYQNWRWQPHHCNLPRFNGTLLLEKLKGKKLIFVGDSLCRNQWVSMLCLIESSLPPSSIKMFNFTGNLQYFHIKEHETTIGFYWSPFLVESNCDDPWQHQSAGQTVRVHGIEKHARHWNDADILVFDSYAWWINYDIQVLWGSVGSPDAIHKTVAMKDRRFEMALNTWSDWLEINVNRSKTKLFFMSASPYTLRGETWGQCYNVTEPEAKVEEASSSGIRYSSYSSSSSSRRRKRLASIVESTLQKLETRGVRVEYVRITGLSEYRRDAHPSIYRSFYTTNNQKQKKLDPNSYADCVHWCLPGVPDVWNQILYSFLLLI
ncbi:protein trichome birefringence-like 34 [Andrographis paniculata]|uniref:protein trichome birefringence-like 34 n=1 Tax=Andrographis paniculata TaxID=175694 RepID=UPI0021E84E1D|nr:protein trichome birefringence-like 34 [Andrographis paniculata]